MWTSPKPTPPGGISIINPLTGGYTSAPTVTIFGGMGSASAEETHTANIPLDPGEFSARETEYPLAIDIGSYGKKKLICKTMHHSGRSVYVVTLNGEVVTTTVFVADAVNHYNAITGGV